MNFTDKTKPPPAGVWLLVRAGLLGETSHFCVKSNSYWYNTRRGKHVAEWDSGDGVSVWIDNTTEAIKNILSFNPFIRGDMCRLLSPVDAEWVDQQAANNIYGGTRPFLPKGFWERNPPFSDRRKDETY